MTQFVSYLRVSTKHQGIEGLGIQSQRIAIANRIGDGILLKEFVEVESGRNTKRPELKKAIETSSKLGCTLIVAKLDRLGRKASHLMEIKDLGIDIVICDMPQINTLTFGMYAVMAQHEAEQIGARTSAALKAKKYQGQPQNLTKDGVRLGAESMKKKKQDNQNNQAALALIKDLMANGATQQKCLEKLNEYGMKTARGKRFSSKTQIARLLAM